jgi:hypothetical protein
MSARCQAERERRMALEALVALFPIFPPHFFILSLCNIF